MPPFSRQSSDDSSAEMSSAHSQRDPVIAIDADKSAIVLGAGGHAKVVISTLHSAGYRVIAVYDDNSALHGTMFQNVPVAGSISQAQSLAGQHAVLGIGDITIRRRLVSGSRLHWISVVSPEACVHESVSLGAGTVVVAGAIVQPDCTIGSHVIVNTGASIDHDSRIEDFSHVAPGATLAGGVRIGTATLVGTAACVAPGVVVGSDTVVGAGAVVVTQLPDGVVAIGCPARQVRPRVPANVVVQSAEWGKKRAA